MLSKLTCVLVAALISVSAAHNRQQTAPPTPQTEAWPPPGVYLPGAGVTPPKALSRAEPTYTPEAMRAKIQGVVVLACVVLADGTVGAVQVRQSLGFGLDERAIAAVRQWKFAPGTRDGVAVPVAVTVNLAFSIRAVTPPSTLPEAFLTAVTAESGWTEDVVQAEGLEIRFAYPAGWSVSKDAAATNRLATLYHETGARSLFIGRPRTLAAAPPQPLPIGDVQRFADGMMRMPLLASGKLERRAFGQGLIGDRWWIWLDLQTTTLPPEIVQASNGAFDGSRMWVFVTMIGAHEVTVFCNRLLLTGSSADDTARLIKQAGAELSGLLNRISIHARRP